MKQKKEIKGIHNVPDGYYERAIKNNPIQRVWHKNRFKNICNLIEPTEGEILDVGSSDGTLTEVIVNHSKAKKIIGIDVLENSVKYANKRFSRDERIEFVTADVHKLPFVNEQFDAIICSDVLEHLDNPLTAVSEFKRVLKPGGYILISVPTESLLFKFSWWIVLHSFGRHWHETHVQDFSKDDSLRTLFEKAGLKIETKKKILLGMLQIIKVRKL